MLELIDVSKTFRVDGHTTVRAVDRVSLRFGAGEVVAIIGESGSGKSTLARVALALLKPDSGTVQFDGADLATLSAPELRRIRSRLTVVFQEPFEALNPRMRVADIVGEPLDIHESGLSGREWRRRVAAALEEVALPGRFQEKFPAELSGGQQQRVNLARALVTRPAFIVLDEPTSSLDLSVQAQVLDLLVRLREEFGLGYMFITHDIGVASFISDRIAVMYGGRILETGSTENLLSRPQHPYTVALLSSVLRPDPSKRPPPLAAPVGEAVSAPAGRNRPG